jgi:hypothetical protein
MKNSKHVRKRRATDFVYNVSRLTCDLEWEFYRYDTLYSRYMRRAWDIYVNVSCCQINLHESANSRQSPNNSSNFFVSNDKY